MLHVVVHPALTTFGVAGAPDQAVKKFWNELRCLVTKHLDDVRVSLEELIHAIVVPVAICPESEEVPYDGEGSLKVPRLH